MTKIQIKKIFYLKYQINTIKIAYQTYIFIRKKNKEKKSSFKNLISIDQAQVGMIYFRANFCISSLC